MAFGTANISAGIETVGYPIRFKEEQTSHGSNGSDDTLSTIANSMV